MAIAVVRPVFAEQSKNVPAKLAPAHSVFVMPASPREGRDPFFPESTRPFEATVSASHAVEMTALTVKGFTIMNGHPMVIINNHSFMVGDEGDVLATGGRVHLKCLEIRSDVAIVEVNGLRHEIHF